MSTEKIRICSNCMVRYQTNKIYNKRVRYISMSIINLLLYCGPLFVREIINFRIC